MHSFLRLSKIIIKQEAMENFIFPVKIDDKMYELMNIFLILTGIPQKSWKKVIFFIFTEQTVKKAFTLGTITQRRRH